MVADKRKPVKVISINGFGKVELIGDGLARVWLSVNHVEDGKIVARLRKKPLQMPVTTMPHSIMLMTQAVADHIARPGVIATITDGDDRESEARR